eukprot:52808_1
MSTTSALTPPTLSYDEVGLNFADSGRSFTTLVNQYFDNPIHANGNPIRKRCRLSLTHRVGTNDIRKMTAYLWDEWRDIMDYVWNITPQKDRKLVQLSITFFGNCVEQIDPDDINPSQQKNVAFVLNRDTHPNAYIEFKTCCNRICGRRGIRLTYNDVINHCNGTNPIDIANNANTLFLKPSYAYIPLSELLPTERSNQPNGFLYGYVTMSGGLKTCTGRHGFYKQIRIRDSSLSWDADDLQIMIFGNDPNAFPNCRESDLIRFHRVEINYRPEHNTFQSLVKLDKVWVAYLVFDGNLTIPNNKEAIKQIRGQKYTFDELVDGYFIKYLKEACRLRQEQTNPDLVRLANQNQVNKVELPNVLTVNRNPHRLLNEIKAEDVRLNVTVMITARLDIIEEAKKNDTAMDVDDQFSFYWVISDGSVCSDNSNVIHAYTKEEHQNIVSMVNDAQDSMDTDDDSHSKIWKCDNNYGDNERIMGSFVKVLVKPEYETAIQCFQEIQVGQWVMLINILFDKDRKELIYDMHSQIDGNATISEDVGRRLELLYYNIIEQTQVVSACQVPQHEFQSYSSIRSVLDCDAPHCKYKILGKCLGHCPGRIVEFTKSGNGLQFVLYIEDASGGVIPVILEKKQALCFFGLDEIGDLRHSNNQQQLTRIEECMKRVMEDTSLLDLCIRSYVPKNKDFVLYKAIDTVLIK